MNLYQYMGNRNEFKKTTNVILYLVVGLFLFWCYYALTDKDRTEKHQKERCLSYQKESFHGVVDSIYDKFKQRCFLLKSDTTEFSMWYYGNAYLHKGDSIVKQVDKSEYEIYKIQYPDSVLILKFSCDAN